MKRLSEADSEVDGGTYSGRATPLPWGLWSGLGLKVPMNTGLHSRTSCLGSFWTPSLPPTQDTLPEGHTHFYSLDLVAVMLVLPVLRKSQGQPCSPEGRMKKSCMLLVSVRQSHPEGLLNCRWWGPHHQSSVSIGLRWDMRICILTSSR